MGIEVMFLYKPSKRLTRPSINPSRRASRQSSRHASQSALRPFGKPLRYTDPWVLAPAILLVLYGFLMVTSASMGISDQHYGSPWHYAGHQLLVIALGAVAAYGVSRVPVQFWYRCSRWGVLLALVLLVLVLVPPLGHKINGSRRWFVMAGVSLQASAVVQPLVILFLAAYMSRYQRVIKHTWQAVIRPLIVVGVISLLLLCQPDFGATVLLCLTTLTLLYLAEARLRLFLAVLCVIVMALAALALLSPYRLARIVAFLHPWHHATGDGYQLVQSLLAFGRGGVLGVGFGNGVQKLFYLPEAHSDFIFSVVAEEFGLMGECVCLGLYAVLVGRVLQLAWRAYQQGALFSCYFLYGVAVSLAFGVIINMGVTVGLLPTKGLTLPFMSYGGSSVLVNSLVVGMILRIADQLHTETRWTQNLSHGLLSRPAERVGTSFRR